MTGASSRNWASYGEEVELGRDIDEMKRALLTDPQTSGGLLVACASEAVPSVLAVFRDESFDRVAVIGECIGGEPCVAVR